MNKATSSIRTDAERACKAMRSTLTDNIVLGMTTAEGEFELGYGFLCVSIAPWGCHICIYDSEGNEKTGLPNIERAIKDAMPTYDGVCSELSEAAEQRADDCALYSSLCRTQGMSLQW